MEKENKEIYVMIYFTEGGLIALSDGVKKSIGVLTAKSIQVITLNFKYQLHR
ncbi:hypothetical protein ACO1PF_04895 [Alkalibacterium sp. f15]|uniref:hypothetical protein n=1 Tax=Alkalibacterium sp. f15 TaxID=3414029 RepID=UPI003BF91335